MILLIMTIEPGLLAHIEKFLHNNDKLRLYQSSAQFMRARKMLTTYNYDDFLRDNKTKNYIHMFDLLLLFGSLDISFTALHTKNHSSMCDELLNRGAVRYANCWACLRGLFVGDI